MATWRDGPAYAPKERPAAFAEPASGVSLAPAPQPPAPAPLPAAPPVAYQAPATGAPPLAQLVHRTANRRDPRQAFNVVTMTLTQPGSAWGSVHNTIRRDALDRPAPAPGKWEADQPWKSGYAPPTSASGGFPAPGTPQWFTTGSTEAHRKVTVPINAQTLVESVGIPYLICLGLGALLSSMSFMSLLIAVACVQITRYRRTAMRVAVVGALLFSFLLYGFGELVKMYFEFAVAAQIGCVLALAAGFVIQYLALKAGDRPERQF